jgi:hypothetical protein
LSFDLRADNRRREQPHSQHCPNTLASHETPFRQTLILKRT